MLTVFLYNTTTTNLQQLTASMSKNIMYNKKKTTWINYISKLNNQTPINKTMEIIRKIKWKNNTNFSSSLNQSKWRQMHRKKEIDNLVATEFQRNSSTDHYSP